MQKIIFIQHVEQFTDKNGKKRWRTHAILDDGSEVVGFGKDFDLGDRVVSFYHHEQFKMQKYKMKK
jgi:hypothetical protein